MEHRGISFSVVEMNFPRGWKWTVGKGRTVTVGVCATRLDAIRQAQTFIDAGSVNHCGADRSRARSSISGSSPEPDGAPTLPTSDV